MKRSILAIATFLMAGLAASPAAAQVGGRVSVMPYVGYGFLGSLPDTEVELEADVAFGARASYQLSDQFALFGNFQRTTPTVSGTDTDFNLDHWSVGAEFSYVPRGGAAGMLPILLEAGLGQARYENGPSDVAANIGIASVIQLNPRFGVRYGANDYISNHDGNGVVNQVYVHAGLEVTF